MADEYVENSLGPYAKPVVLRSILTNHAAALRSLADEVDRLNDQLRSLEDTQ